MNPINKKDNKYSQNAVEVVSNHEEIKKDPLKITKIKPFLNQYNWKGINFPSEKDDWKNIEKNNVTIALHIFHAKREKKDLAYVSKHNSNREKQVILLMISNGEGCHYLTIKKLSALLKGITSKHKGDFYCLNCLHSFRTKKIESHKRVCENKDFCNIIMPSEDSKILEFNQYQKSDKAPFIIYADLECLIEKTDGCKNNPENSHNKSRQIYSIRFFNVYNIFI